MILFLSDCGGGLRVDILLCVVYGICASPVFADQYVVETIFARLGV